MLVVASLLDGIHLSGPSGALVAALLLGILNALIRPLLLLLTLPLNILTLGLFTFVVNATVLSLAAAALGAFAVDSFGWALVGALLLSMVSAMLSALVGK